MKLKIFLSSLIYLVLSGLLFASDGNNLNFTFIKNLGQEDREIAFYNIYNRGKVGIKSNGEIIYFIQRDGKIIKLEERVGKKNTNPIGVDKQDTEINYILGYSNKLNRRIECYRQVDLGYVSSGIKLSLIAHNNGIEKVFEIHPYANPEKIEINIKGLNRINVNEEGKLIINDGIIVYEKPYAYQDINGKRVFVKVDYKVNGNRYGFSIGKYDKSKPLIIDPLLSATYLGGSLIDSANDIVVDNSNGDVYVVGSTTSLNFPVTIGSYDISYNSNQDVFIIVFNRTLSKIKRATFFGGSGIDTGKSIKFDNTGNVFIIGDTTSQNLPTTTGAFSRTYGGSDLPDGFIAKFNKSLTNLLAGTYLGGSNGDVAKTLAIDSTGNVYVAGVTSSVDFPTTIGSHDPTYNGNLDIFVSKLNNSLSTLLISTFLGGTGDDGLNGVSIEIDNANNYLYIAGDTNSINFPVTANSYNPSLSGGLDGFVTKMGVNDFLIASSTYIGGVNDDGVIDLHLKIVDNRVFITGFTNSIDFPTTAGVIDRNYNGNLDIFISALDLNLENLVASTYMGSSGNEIPKRITLLSDGDLIIAGETTSANFPMSLGGFDLSFNGVRDVFLIKVDPLLTNLKASSFYGGNGLDLVNGLAISNDQYIYLVGLTTSTNLPTIIINPDRTLTGTQDGFIAKFDKNLSNLTGEIFSSPASYDFGGTIIKTTSLSQVFTIKNNGLGDLEIGLSKITGRSNLDFQISGDTCSDKTLLPLQECSITVVFNPKTVGTKSASLIVPSSDALNPLLNIALTGLGLPAIVLTSPNGGEIFATGSTYAITWDLNPGVSLVDIQYSINNGFTWVYIARNISGTSFNWTVPALPKNSKAFIKVTGKDATGKVLGTDRSNNPFLIEVVRLLTPNGSEIYTSGDIPVSGISWNTNATISPVSSVKLFISFNNGFTWRLITTVSGNPGFYSWIVPTVSRTVRACRIKVILLDSNNKNIGTDISDSMFTINPI
ncbi:MAG: SBBP repeat-containing protein [Proteobacteria bacterium]|nr:SBBP repeat-containing protein [Pseudomonadota bacterium]